MKIYAKTDIGKARETNQDSYYIEEGEDSDFQVYILADGMGGYTGGEIASSLAVNSVKTYINNNLKKIECKGETIKQCIKEAIEYANMMVNEKANEDENICEMGTTLDVAIIYDNRIYIGHVGDSRVYRIRKNIIRRLTTDHSYVEKLLRDGSITKEEAMNHPKKHMLIKVIGSNTFAEPDIIEKKIIEGDTILMCSDGLSNMLSEEEILQMIQEEEQNIAEALVEKANEMGGHDNITVIVIKV